jgi:hypothetical protein
MSEGRVVLHLWLIPLSGKYFENLWEEDPYGYSTYDSYSWAGSTYLLEYIQSKSYCSCNIVLTHFTSISHSKLKNRVKNILFFVS